MRKGWGVPRGRENLMQGPFTRMRSGAGFDQEGVVTHPGTGSSGKSRWPHTGRGQGTGPPVHVRTRSKGGGARAQERGQQPGGGRA